MIERLMREWDGEYVVMRYDHAADAWIFIAIHSTGLGPALGGTRMKAYNSPADALQDAQRLAEGMTYKWAGIDFPQGGGKAVISLTRNLSDREREELLERYGSLVEALRGQFATGLDLGISPEDILVIARKTRYVHGAREGSPGDPGPYTALGVFSGIQAVLAELFGDADPKDRTVLIQGVGDVGLPLAELLSEAGARLKLSDLDEARVREAAQRFGAEVIEAEAVYDEPCDILAPCAVGAVLNADSIARLQCRAVAGSANNQLDTREDAARLHERGILYSPDYIINAGGAIALNGVEVRGMSEEEARERIVAIGDTLKALFEEARDRDESPLLAAERRAYRVLQRGP